MNNRRHASLAKTLIDRCGGLEEAALACRVKKSALSDYQNPNKPWTMPADVICALEGYCGEAIYSRALSDCRPSEASIDDVVTEVHDVAIAVAALLPLAVALKAGQPGARAAWDAAVAKLAEEVDDVEAIGNVTRIRGAKG